MNLKNIRQEKGITQANLAEMLNVNQSTISKWECQTAGPTLATLQKITNVLNCSLDELLKK